MSPTLRAWLQLFRAPNLFTVPGDSLVGFIIITGGWLNGMALVGVVASLCFYAAGLAMNDLADLEEDRRDRPNRPLPSGAISPSAAKGAVLLLVSGGLALLWAFTSAKTTTLGAGLVISITLYNYITKKIPVLGAINMGACRTLSLLLGAFVAGAENHTTNPAYGGVYAALISVAVAVGIYIAAITQLAFFETHTRAPKWARFLPLGALLAGYLLMKRFTGPAFLDPCPTLLLMMLFLAFAVTGQLLREPPAPIPPRIGTFIRLLLIMQAAVAVMPSIPERFPKTPHSLLLAGILLAAFPLSSWVGKRFYAS